MIRENIDPSRILKKDDGPIAFRESLNLSGSGNTLSGPSILKWDLKAFFTFLNHPWLFILVISP